MFDKGIYAVVGAAVTAVVLYIGASFNVLPNNPTSTPSPSAPAVADLIDVARFCADSNTHVTKNAAGVEVGVAYELSNSVTKQYVNYKYTITNGVVNDLADYIPSPGANVVPAQRVTADALNCILKKGGR